MVLLGLWLLFGVVAGMISARQGQGLAGFLLGLLLGPFGVAVTIGASYGRTECPSCRELIKRRATICPFCHATLPQPSVEASQNSFAYRLGKSARGVFKR